MLDRNKLAKQFELVVQQEIKNHQDAVYSNNQSLNEIKVKIEEMSNQSLENYALISSQQKYLEIEIDKIKDFIKIISQKLESHVCDQRNLNERNSIEYQDVVETLEKRLRLEVNFFDRLREVENQNHNVLQSNAKSIKTVENNLESWHSRFLRDVSKFKEEIYSMPTGLEADLEDMAEKIAANYIDVEGIMREINVFKKSTYIVEKKLENIYTLIERMKGEKI